MGFHRDQCTAADPATHMRVVQVADRATPDKLGAVESKCVGKGAVAVDGGPLLAKLKALANAVKPPVAKLHVEPGGGKTLVQIPTLMYADPQNPIDRPTVVDGFPVKLHAVLTSWTWIVDGEEDFSTDHPGGGYDGTDPRTANPGYYIAHTFTMHGKHSIAVRTMWTSTATQSDGSPLPVQGVAYATSPTYAVTALQAKSRLESGTGGDGSAIGPDLPPDLNDPDGDGIVGTPTTPDPADPDGDGAIN